MQILDIFKGLQLDASLYHLTSYPTGCILGTVVQQTSALDADKVDAPLQKVALQRGSAHHGLAPIDQDVSCRRVWQRLVHQIADDQLHGCVTCHA